MPIRKCPDCGFHYQMARRVMRCEPCNARHKKALSKSPTVLKKNAARAATKEALASGVLKWAPCEICGEQKSEAHHIDYDDPLRINWLCRKHHMQLHTRLRWRESMAGHGYTDDHIREREIANWGSVFVPRFAGASA